MARGDAGKMQHEHSGLIFGEKMEAVYAMAVAPLSSIEKVRLQPFEVTMTSSDNALSDSTVAQI